MVLAALFAIGGYVAIFLAHRKIPSFFGYNFKTHKRLAGFQPGWVGCLGWLGWSDWVIGFGCGLFRQQSDSWFAVERK